MTITLAVSMPTDDFRNLLQNLVDAVLDDVYEMTPQMREAVERAIVALERGVH